MAITARTFDRLLALAALAGAVVIALTASGLGDYPTDAGPALTAIAHGNLSGFFSHQPAMGAVSLYLRAPFVILAAALHDSPVGMYRLGDLPCVLAVALVALWMARTAGRRGMGPVGRTVMVAACLLVPLVGDALYWGHPEELLTAGLAAGALLAACEQRGVLAAVLAGLAVASKQWALLVVCPTLLVLERERIRAAAVMFTAAAVSTLPMVIGNFAAFRHALHYISTPQPVTTFFTWLYPLSPPGIVHISNIFGDARTFSAHTVPATVSEISHPLIIALGVAIPLLVWLRAGRHPSVQAMLSATALVFLLRCALDPSSIAYYHFPLLLTLVALDATSGRRIPTATIVGFVAAFTVLDRFPDYLPANVANAVYVLASVAAVAALTRALRTAPRLSDGPPGGDRSGRLPRLVAASD